MQSLIDQIHQRVRSGRDLVELRDVRRALAPARPPQIVRAEGMLGFPLPGLLRDIYLMVANGGIGPGYGLFGIEGGHGDWVGNRQYDLVQVYVRFRANGRTPSWPERLLPICSWGAAVYSCIDVALPDAPIMAFDPNRAGDGPWRREYRMHARSFAEWLERWLAGEDLWKSMPLVNGPALDRD